ncbi:hypothetical protein DRQ33_08525 [bacterium]|nr:MAG: hypothetical protein DRQ33_08525 [bacterium]
MSGYWVSNDGGNEGVFVATNGNVGIGTSSPADKLDVSGNIRITGSNYLFFPTIVDVSGTGGGNIRIGGTDATGMHIDDNEIQTFSDGLHLQLDSGQFVRTYNNTYLATAGGNVGIGTTSPSYKLDVSGTGRFTGALTIGAYTLPNTDGTSGYVLKTDGAGNVSWQVDGGASASPGGANGAVQFNNSGSFGGSNNLHWDNTNSRLGIGTTGPTEKLDVEGNIEMNSNRIKNVATPTTGASAVGDAVSTTYMNGKIKSEATSGWKIYRPYHP